MVPIDALVTVLVLSVLLAVIYGPWQAVCSDYARQIIFEKRDAIFDMAIAGRMNFNSQQYRIIRTSLEKNIRFAHEATWTYVLFLYIFAPKTKFVGRPSAIRQAIARITDADTRHEIEVLVDEAQTALILMMIAKSPLLLVIALIVGPVIWLRHGIERATRPIAETLQVEAENIPILSRVTA